MKFRLKIIRLIILAISLSFATPINASPVEKGDQKEVKSVVVAYFKALNESDVDKIVELYHQKSVFLPNHAPSSIGLDDITKTYRMILSEIKLNTEHVYRNISVYGDIAIVESQASGTLTLLKNGQMLPANNKELFVLRKINKKWKIDYYMFNDSENHTSSSSGP